MRAVNPSVPASGSSATAGSWYRQENSNASELTSSTTAASVTSRHGTRRSVSWPVPAAPLPTIKAAGAPPILVVGTTRDPATPYRSAQALAADLSSGVLLGWNGDGHTAYGEGSACVDTIVNAYLISLKVPRGGTVCP